MTATSAVYPCFMARRPVADLDEADDQSTFARCPAFPAAAPATAMTAQHPEIRPEQSIELLKQLHILTRDGKLNQDSRRKLKQVYHLYQFIEPLLEGAETLADLYRELEKCGREGRLASTGALLEQTRHAQQRALLELRKLVKETA